MKNLLSKNLEPNYSPSVYVHEIWRIEANESYVRSYLRDDRNDISIYKDKEILVALRTYEGEGKIILEDKEYDLPTDSIFIFKICQPRKYWTVNKKWKFFWVEFKTLDLSLQLNKPTKMKITQNELATLKQCHSRLGVYPYCKIAAAQFAALLTEYDIQMKSETPKDDPYHEHIISYIATHYSDPELNVKKLALKIGLSERQLYNIFLKNFKIPPQEYLRKYRLKIALESLLDFNLTINQVSYACGFNDQYYFSYAFKKEFKMTPSEYRKSKKIINPSEQE